MDNAKRPQSDNLLSFMLRELVFFFGYHLQFASYPYSFASYLYSFKILQLHVTATVRMHSDEVICAIGDSRVKTVRKFILINN